jgi:hypothetical protein
VPAGSVPEDVLTETSDHGRPRLVLLCISPFMYQYYLSDDLELSKTCSMACPF